MLIRSPRSLRSPRLVRFDSFVGAKFEPHIQQSVQMIFVFKIQRQHQQRATAHHNSTRKAGNRHRRRQEATQHLLQFIKFYNNHCYYFNNSHNRHLHDISQCKQQFTKYDVKQRECTKNQLKEWQQRLNRKRAREIQPWNYMNIIEYMDI